MAVEHLFTPADEPPGEPNGSNDGTNYTLGYTVKFAVAGNVTGLRARGPADHSPDVQRGKLFRKSDQALLGFVDFVLPVAFGTFTGNSVDFASPVAVDPDEECVVCYYVSGTAVGGGFGHTVFSSTLGSDKVNGNVTAVAHSGCIKVASALDDFPGNTVSIPDLLFWIDVNFEAAPTGVAVAGTVSAVASATAAVAKVAKASGAVSAASSGTAVATKVASVSGRCTAIAGGIRSTASSVTLRPSAGTTIRPSAGVTLRP